MLTIEEQRRQWRERTRRYRLAHPERRYRVRSEKEKTSSRKWAKTHPESRHASNKKWRLAHPEQVRARARKYAQAHPEQMRASTQRRRAKKGGLPCTLTVSEWQAICAAYKQRCAYCGKKRPLEQDHVLALSKGGGTVAGNIVPACHSCNCGKQDRPPQKPVKLVLGI